MAKKIRVALYSRVSTEIQNTDGQEAEMKEYAKNRGWEVTRIYRDKMIWSEKLQTSVGRTDGGCEETKDGHRSRLALRPICEVCLSSTPGPGDIPRLWESTLFQFQNNWTLQPRPERWSSQYSARWPNSSEVSSGSASGWALRMHAGRASG